MIDKLSYNEIVDLSNLFRDDNDFVFHLINDANNNRNHEMIEMILKTKEECNKGNHLSNEVLSFMNDNAEYLLSEMEKRKETINNESVISEEKESVQEEEVSQDENLEEEQEKEEPTNEVEESIEETENIDIPVEPEAAEETETVEENQPEPVQEEQNNYVEVRDSAQMAVDNVKNEMIRVDEEIQNLEHKMNYSESIPTKSDYRRLFQLKAYKDSLEGKLHTINLGESYGDDERIDENDDKLDNIDNKINNLNQRLHENKPKFIKKIIEKRIKRLEKKRGKIERKQRKLVNKDLIQYYKGNLKESRRETKEDSMDKYYDDRINYYQEKRDSILDNVDYENTNKFTTRIKNAFYKLRSIPSSMRIEYYERLKNKEGIFRGSRHVDRTITDILYDAPVLLQSDQRLMLPDSIEEPVMEESGRHR